MIETTQDLAIRSFYLDQEEATYTPQGLLNSEGWISKCVYKFTSCGAWIDFTQTGIKIGSIIEGIEQNTSTHALDYPFPLETFNATLQEVEKEANDLWNESHGCTSCNDPDLETGWTAIDPACKECNGQGIII
jgi:hypothetical protein